MFEIWRFLCLVMGMSVVFGQEMTNVSIQVTTAKPELASQPPPPPPDTCVSPMPEECPEGANCKKVQEDGVICCHISSTFKLKENIAGMNMTVIKSISVRNVTLLALDASFFFDFSRSLQSLSITNGNISRVIGRFPASVTCLNLSGNKLVEIEDNALSSLTKLNYLDISWNNLTKLPNISVLSVENFWLDVSGKITLPCLMIKELRSKMNNDSTHLHFVNKNESYCNLEVMYWFKNKEIVPLTQLDQLDEVKDCPQGPNYNCTCNVHRLEFPMSGHSSSFFSVAVDCSGLQLTELPPNLPSQTVSLNVSNNNISDLTPLVGRTGTGYSKIRELYADNNRISSINFLEGSDFISSFVVLSLKNNELSEIPTYFLSSRFDRNDIFVGNVDLGGNKIECNCDTIILKTWLKTNHLHVRDYDQVQCKNMELSVIQLQRSQVCVYKHVWTDYIYYIIFGEVALLLMLVGKVSYDYWVFKTAGYLPWPASKMPKLPCDCVLEM